MNPKPIWQSKTVWANALALLGTFVLPQTGVKLEAEEQVAILVVINLVLRLLTKGAVDWNKPAAPLLLACLLPLAPCVTTGCANPQQAAYRTVGAIGVTASAAHEAWKAYAATGQASAEEKAKVTALWNKYCAAYALACDAGKTASEATGKPAWEIALAALKNCESDLIATVKQFLPADLAAKLNSPQ